MVHLKHLVTFYFQQAYSSFVQASHITWFIEWTRCWSKKHFTKIFDEQNPLLLPFSSVLSIYFKDLWNIDKDVSADWEDWKLIRSIKEHFQLYCTVVFLLDDLFSFPTKSVLTIILCGQNWNQHTTIFKIGIQYCWNVCWVETSEDLGLTMSDQGKTLFLWHP